MAVAETVQTHLDADLSPAEYALLCKRIWHLARVDLHHYKRPQMVRRLNALLARSGFDNWVSYFDYLARDEAALQSFRSYLTINVTKFFRDPHKWTHLADVILPQLLRERPRLRLWSAGCSQGAEPYTLAMLLDELGQAESGHSILATDIDDGKLAVARAGGPYKSDDLEHVSAPRRSRYLEWRDGAWWIRHHRLPAIAFRHHDLLNDPFAQGYDLIVCRNVVIYFVDEVKRALYARFAEALRPGGILFVGGTESIPSAPDLGLRSAGISFYRKEPVE